MRFAPGRWRPKLVLLGCAIYGASVALITFAPALRALWRVTRPSAGHGVVSVSADSDLILHMTMSSAGLPTFSDSINIAVFLLWMLAPPLLFWLAWRPYGGRTPSELDHDLTGRGTRSLDQPDFDPLTSHASADRQPRHTRKQ